MQADFFNKIKAEYNLRQVTTIREINSLQSLVKNVIKDTIQPEIDSYVYSTTNRVPGMPAVKAIDGQVERAVNKKELELISTYEVKAIARLDEDQEIHKLLIADNNSNQGASFAFKTNKLSEIFTCAKDVLNKYGLHQLLNKPLMGKLEEKNTEGFSFETTNKTSTSYLNCVQTTFLTTLSIIENKSNFQDLELFQKINSYNVETSPVVQTTKFPESYVPTNYTLADGKNIDITKWFYYYKDDKSPTQGELLTPTLGYQFGGTRDDARYHAKELKSEDCSSAASKWIGFKDSISTVDYELIYLNQHPDKNLNENKLIKPFYWFGIFKIIKNIFKCC
jgi:hypothetical protein